MTALAAALAELLDALARLAQPLVSYLVARWAVEGRAAAASAERLARQRDVAAGHPADRDELLRRMRDDQL